MIGFTCNIFHMLIMWIVVLHTFGYVYLSKNLAIVVQSKGYGTTQHPGMRVLIKSAATSALGRPTSFGLVNITHTLRTHLLASNITLTDNTGQKALLLLT